MLKNKIAIITGGSRGIGRAISECFASYGATACIVARGADAGEAACRSIIEAGGQSRFYQADITDRADCVRVVEAVVQHHGTVDILVNCAGTGHSAAMMDVTDAIWDQIMDLNLRAALYMTQAAGAVMREKQYGRIVNISSIAGKFGEEMNGTYCISKAGLNMMTQVFGRELAPDGITVNAVCPGFTDTELLASELTKRSALFGQTPEALTQEIKDGIPMRRFADPQEIAEVVAFLASDRAAVITGCAYTASCGLVTI